MLSLFLVFLTVVLIVRYFLRLDNYWKQHNVQSVPFTKSFFGQISNLIFRTKSILVQIQGVYDMTEGRYLGTMQFGTPALFIKDPELIKKVMVKNFENFPDRQWFKMDTENDPLICNLTSLTGQKWKSMRSILSPAFTSSKMRGMFTHMQDSSEQFVDYFDKQLADKDVLSLEMKDTFTRYTNDVIANAVFGVKCDSLVDKENEFFMTGKEIAFSGPKMYMRMMGYIMFPSLMHFLKVKFFGKAGDYFANLVEDVVDKREKEGIVRMDMIHLLMEARKGQLKIDGKEEEADTGFATVSESKHEETGDKLEMTLDAIKANAILFFASGFDTTATVLSFLAYELAVNPDVQEKLQNEIDETLKKYNGQITYEGLLQMKYLDMVVCESLRLWPPAFLINRQCAKPTNFEPELPNEKTVPIERGCIIRVPLFSIQRDPKYFENPNKFIPERFSDENKHKIQPYTYMPFGMGPRNCISSRFGLLEVKTMMFYFLSKFNLVVTEKTDVPLKLAKAQFVLNTENGFWLGVTKRTNV